MVLQQILFMAVYFIVLLYLGANGQKWWEQSNVINNHFIIIT